jgi:hypothetical protein
MILLNPLLGVDASDLFERAAGIVVGIIESFAEAPNREGAIISEPTHKRAAAEDPPPRNGPLCTVWAKLRSVPPIIWK